MEPNLSEAERRIEEARRTQAETLDLGDLALPELPTSLGDLPRLKELYLGTRKLTESVNLEHGYYGLKFPALTDLSPLTTLRGLWSLDLSACYNVQNLSPLVGLTELQTLDLSGTGVKDLTPLAGLAGLLNLHLSGTGVTDLAPLAGLPRLQSLRLYGCRSAIPKQLLRALSARLTELVADKAVGVPREVLSRERDENCLSRLRAFLAELDLASETENEVKVILLGNGRVGKTQLSRRFRAEPFDESVPSTHGIQIWRKELLLRTEDQEKIFQVNWWDFGGQDIYHGTHALFLRSRAVFLILWAPHLENQDEYEENGIPLRNQPLAYWLDYVRSLAGEDSPVIVVQSQCDRFDDQRPTSPRPDGFGFFQSCAYSAKTDLGRDPLEAQLREAIRFLNRTGELEIGRGRAEVRRKLYEWRSEDQAREPEHRQHRTLTIEEFQALCDETGGIVSGEHCLDYLHQTGVVFYDADLFSNCIVLDQSWALDAVYSVFHRGQTVPWLRDSGRFTREDLAATVWSEHSIDEQKLFLGLMKSCGVCFPCGKTPRGEERYVAPDLLPGFEAFAGRTRVLDAWNEAADTIVLSLKYRFFHPAVIRGLMSRIGEKAGDRAEYWKLGLWLKDGQRDAQLLVQFVDTSTAAALGAGVLELKAQGRDVPGLLREIRRILPWQRIGDKPDELLTLNGASLALAALSEDRERRPDDTIDISPQPPKPDEKPREVFVSYAWGDDTPAGKIRDQTVTALCAAFEKDGFRPVRDCDTMRPGDLISAFMRRLTCADLVVAVISDKYLRSPYCMDEIHGLWQKSQEDPALLAENLVPIMLPEVKIARLQDRAPYLRYWKAQREELEALQRELGADFGLQSHREFRLVRNFAQDVDGILTFLQDILMPRNLDAHLDDGFQAVRDALRRRLG